MRKLRNGERRYLDIIAGWVRRKPQICLAEKQFQKTPRNPYGTWIMLWQHEDTELVQRAIRFGENYNKSPFDR